MVYEARLLRAEKPILRQNTGQERVEKAVLRTVFLPEGQVFSLRSVGISAVFRSLSCTLPSAAGESVPDGCLKGVFVGVSLKLGNRLVV